MRFIRAIWRFISRPSQRALGTLLVIGVAAGVIFTGGFHWALEATNTESFCISCHEMRSTVYQELKETPHYTNPSGVRATCPDCHVPKEYTYKIARKIQATFNELPKHFIGYLDTKEKFEAHRLEMAKNVWATMEANDSRECRNCHEMNFMELQAQAPRARGQHADAQEEGETCIDCHKGIAHKDVSDQLEKPEGEEGGGGGFMLE